MAKNKMFRKQFAITASAAMLAGTVIPAAVAYADLDDVAEGQKSFEAVTALTAKGIIHGYEDNKFHGELTVKRKHAVLFLNRALGLDAPADVKAALEGLTDVSAEDVRYGAAVATLVKAGIFSGNTDGTFALEGELTRQQMATVLVRAFGLKADSSVEVTLNDLDKVSKHHVEDVKVLFQNGITSGKADGSYDPNAAITRAEFAILLHRAMENATTQYSVKVEAGLTNFQRVVTVDVDTDTPENFTVSVLGQTLSYQAEKGVFAGLVDATPGTTEEDVKSSVKVVNLAGLLETVTVQEGISPLDRAVSVKLSSEASHKVTVLGKELAYQENAGVYAGIVATTKTQEELAALVYVDGVLQTGASQPSQSGSPVTEKPVEEPAKPEQPSEMPAVINLKVEPTPFFMVNLVELQLDTADASLYTVSVLGKALEYKDGKFVGTVQNADKAKVEANLLVELKK